MSSRTGDDFHFAKRENLMDGLSLYRIIHTEKLTGGVDDLPVDTSLYTNQEGEFHMETSPSQSAMAWETQGFIIDRTCELLGKSERGISVHQKRLGENRSNWPSNETIRWPLSAIVKTIGSLNLLRANGVAGTGRADIDMPPSSDLLLAFAGCSDDWPARDVRGA